MAHGLVHVYRVQPEFGVSSEEAVEAIVTSLEKANRPDVLKAWTDAKTKIINALKGLNEEHPLVISHEGGIASNSRANIVSAMKLFTDTRAVFNEAGEKVLFTVINHTLLVEYLEGYDRKEIQFSLDAADMAILAGLCMDADTQASAMKGIISGPVGMSYEAEGEDEAEDE